MKSAEQRWRTQATPDSVTWTAACGVSDEVPAVVVSARGYGSAWSRMKSPSRTEGWTASPSGCAQVRLGEVVVVVVVVVCCTEY